MTDYDYKNWNEAVMALNAAAESEQGGNPYRNPEFAEKTLFALCHKRTKAERQALIRELQRVDEVSDAQHRGAQGRRSDRRALENARG